MRRLHFGLLAAGLPILALSVALVGCGGNTSTSSSTSSNNDKPTDGKTTDSKKSTDWKALEPGKGTISGKVTLKGNKPDIKKMNDELMVEINKNPNKDFCLKGTGQELEEQAYRIDSNGNVENVFVWLQPADKTSYFKIDNAEKMAKSVEIDQPHCAFIPHAGVLFPSYRDPANPKNLKSTNQKVVVKNNATDAHNTNYSNDSKTIPGENKQLKPGEEMPLVGIIPSYTEPVKLKCNIHGWMTAYLWAFDHPYAAVTAKDGSYKIENVPTGVKMKIVAWHEGAGFITKGEDFEAKDGDNTKNFELEAK